MRWSIIDVVMGLVIITFAFYFANNTFNTMYLPNNSQPTDSPDNLYQSSTIESNLTEIDTKITSENDVWDERIKYYYAK